MTHHPLDRYQGEHAEAQLYAMQKKKYVIRRLQVSNIRIDHMELRAWYLFLPCGSVHYIGKYNPKLIKTVIDLDLREHQWLQDYAQRRNNGRQ